MLLLSHSYLNFLTVFEDEILNLLECSLSWYGRVDCSPSDYCEPRLTCEE